jgi:hypothetical protein
MYSTKVLGNSGGALNINHSTHKAQLKNAVKTKAKLPHGAKKK